MKMKYERPVMKAELFTTNSYCGSCKEAPQVSTGILHVDPAYGSLYYTSLSNQVNINNSAFKEYDMIHSFDKSSLRTFQYSGDTNYYYTCNCEDHTGKYFLEYSTQQTEMNRGNPVFFLYQDTNGNGTIQPSPATSWPALSRGQDRVISRVTFAEGFEPVVNS